MLGACLVFFILLQQTQGYDGRAHICISYSTGTFINIHANCNSHGADKRLNILEAYYQLSTDGCSTNEATLDPCRGGLDVLTHNVSAKCNGRSSCTYFFTFPSPVECNVENAASGAIIVVFIYFDCVLDVTAATSSIHSTPPPNSPDSSTESPTQPPTNTTKPAEPADPIATTPTSARPTTTPTEPTATKSAVQPLSSTQSADTNSIPSLNPTNPNQPSPAGSAGPVTNIGHARPVWPIAVGICVALLVLCVIIAVVVKLRLYSKRGDKFGTTSNLQRPSAGQENIYAVDDVPLVENEPGPATNPSQTVTQAAEAPSTEDAESPYGYDTPCDVHPDRMDDAGHYEDYDNDPSNVTENNRNSMALNSEVTPHYTYDTPCEVRIDPADAKMS